MKIIHHNGLGFVIIPKAGGSSIKLAMREGMGLQPEGGIHADKRLQYTSSADGLYSVAFIRHPLDRLVSAWANKIHSPAYIESRLAKHGFRLNMPFADFVRHVRSHCADAHIQPQTKFLPPKVDLLGRFEDMGKHWLALQRRFSWLPDLPHANRTDHQPWHEMYDAELTAIAEDIYKDDLALWHSLSA